MADLQKVSNLITQAEWVKSAQKVSNSIAQAEWVKSLQKVSNAIIQVEWVGGDIELPPITEEDWAAYYRIDVDLSSGIEPQIWRY